MEERVPYSAYRWLILTCACMSLISYTIDMIVYAPIFGEVAKDLNVHMASVINLAMAFAIAVAVSTVIGGILVDKYGLTVVLVAGLLCASVPASLMPWIGHNYTAVFVSRLIQGLVAMAVAAIGPILALWFPQKEQGLAGGLMMCCLSLGPAIGVVASPAVLEAVGTWQRTVAILSIPGWLALAMVLLFTRRRPSVEVVEAITGSMRAPGAEAMTYGKIFSMPMTWIGTAVLFVNCWGLYGLYNLIPSYLAAPTPIGVGVGPVMAGKLSLALIAVGIPAFIVGGIFFDKVARGNHKPAITVGFIVTGLFTYFLLSSTVYNNMLLLVACLMIAGWGMSFMAPSLSAFIAMNYPPRFVGTMMGWWFGFGTFGGALGTYLAGLATARAGNFYWALTPISLASLLGLFLGLMLKAGRSSSPDGQPLYGDRG
ncbi:MFS transporter [Syntrophorhabdus aromaticivorans]|uniref:MFS transporter n=1 Tax=Syntrophorhabdus aromaticivorans TaxID=328301 RepID=UPI0004299221|nr:MFS transporter [Syntrophorhabdus aromaticivorans]